MRWLKTKAKGDTGKDTLSEVAEKDKLSDSARLRQILEVPINTSTLSILRGRRDRRTQN